jgi:hypothetical protein
MERLIPNTKPSSKSMSINNIQLPPFIVKELYGDTLLYLPVEGPTAATTPPAPPPVQSPGQSPISRPAAAKPAAPAASSSSPPETPPAQPAELPGFKFLGNHRRKITILVHSPGTAFLPDDQLSFLTKMLEACRMNIGDVAIINTATAPVTIAALRQQLAPVTILLFGMEPTAIRLPINFPVFRLQPYDDCTYLSAPALDLLVQPSEDSKLLKSKLWVCLKSLFNV